MEELSTTQIGARLDVSERTVQRWIKSGKIKATLQANGYYLVDPADIDALRMPTLPTTSAPALADILNRLETLEQQVNALQRQIAALSSQPRIRIPQSQQAPSASSASHRGVSEALIWLEPDIVAWRPYARVHHIGETGVLERIRSGKLPVVQGSWRIDKTLYQQGLNAEGRRTFHALYHLLLPCPLCGID